jgi:Na+/H+-dicarboxylate symporter
VLRIIKSFFALKLTYRILWAFIAGGILGTCFRLFPEVFLNIGLDIAKLKILGSIFINLIKMIIAPLIFTSIVSSVISVGDVKKTGKLAAKSMLTFLSMTIICVATGMLAVELIRPGDNVGFDKDAVIASSSSATSSITSSKHAQVTKISDFIFNIVPSNIFESLYNCDFLQIIFFATIFAIAIMRVGEDKAGHVTKGITALSDIMFGISDVVMNFAPFGIFGLTSWLIGTQNLELIKSLGMLIVALYGSCIFVIYVIYALFALLVLKLNPVHFFRKIAPSQVLGYLTASSSSALPLSMNIAENRLGVSREKTSFVIPLGATVNMNGGAIHLGMSTLFIAQLWGVSFGMSDYVTIMILCVLGAIGTAPVPGASIFLLAGILGSMGLPVDAVAIILAVDRILDMARTFTNITGDVFSAVIVDRLDDTLNEDVYNSK